MEFPAWVTALAPHAFIHATDPDAVTAFTANAPATRIAKPAINATAIVVFTRVHLPRFSSDARDDRWSSAFSRMVPRPRTDRDTMVCAWLQSDLLRPSPKRYL